MVVVQAHYPVRVSEGDIELHVVVEPMRLVCFREVELGDRCVVDLYLHLLRVDDREEEADRDAEENDDGGDDAEYPPHHAAAAAARTASFSHCYIYVIV